MGIASDILDDWHAARAALLWMQEMGVTDPVQDMPVDRYALAERAPRGQAIPAEASPTQAGSSQAGYTKAGPARAGGRPAAPPPPADPPKVDPVAEARLRAAGVRSLEQLRMALADFPHCDLRQGARNTVFADGNPQARVMVIGEAPGRDEDQQGLPFVGRAGQLLNRMFAAIGLDRASPDSERALYITNVMPWRPPSNRDPLPAEMAMMVPFLERHVELAQAEILVVMGNTPAQAVLGTRGITRLRGQWQSAWGRPVLPMLHPAYLLRNPAAKREAWADLLALQARLRDG